MAVDEWRVQARSLWAPTDDSRGSSPDSCHSGRTFDGGKALRKRASRPKVRTGCICCKRRHLKCDERKPVCQRCETFGIECEGYEPLRPIREIKPVTRGERLLLPRPSRRSGLLPVVALPTVPAAPTAPAVEPSALSVLAVASTAQAPPPVGEHDNTNFIDAYTLSPFLANPPTLALDWEDDDNHYWSMFAHQVVNDLSPHFESDFWSRVLLRESMSNDCIRHSILGIGAYCRAISSVREDRAISRARGGAHATADDGTDDVLWMDAPRNKHHQAALSHHTKALSHLRRMMKRPDPDTRLTIMATLLFIVFENMRGHYHTAGSLTISGIRILRCTAAKSGPDSDTALPAEPVQPPPMTAATPSLLSPSPPTHSTEGPGYVTCRTTPAPARPSPPASLRSMTTTTTTTDVEDEMAEMIRMFARHSVVCVYIPFPHSKYAYNMLLESRLDPSFPAIVATLDQARRAWDFYFPHLGTFLQQNTWQNLNIGFAYDAPAAAAEQAEHLEWLARFGVVLDALRLQMRPNAQGLSSRRIDALPGEGKTAVQWRKNKAARGLELLAIQHAAATIFASCCLDATEMAYDAFVPQFNRLVAQCATIIGDLRHPRSGSEGSETSAAQTAPPPQPNDDHAPEPGFANEANLLPVLGFVMSKCRSYPVRTRALQLVREFHAREGSWDSRSLANGMAGLLALEEPERGREEVFNEHGMIAATIPAGGQQQQQQQQQQQRRITSAVIPARERWVWTNAHWDVDRRQMLAQYTRVLPNERGVYEQREFSMPL